MAPKALTDCPENLREAIDWLIQVKHCGGISTVSDALASLFDNVARDAEKSQPSLLDSDRPSARDVVSKLRAFQSTLPEDSENPHKNIIHNLCASAGSLLGYRYPGTYYGSGIVYGNASRLCHAILAFLYPVFSDVHDNQPYVAGRSVLRDDVIVELKSQLWRGHKGFCQAIPRVATGLQRYNAAVKASNERVKEPIETVLNYVKPDGELCKGIKDLQISETSPLAEYERTVSTAVSLVEGCKEVARVFSRSLTAATNAINDFNPKLKRKLENARRSFFSHVDWLSRWSKKGEKKRLDKMVQKIKSKLKRFAKAVKDKIKQEVHAVVEVLKDRVKEFRMKLEAITVSLEKYVKELGQWMGEAKEYINAVKKYVDQIMKQLDGEHRKAIDRAAADIDSELGKKVEELNKWIEDADAAVKAAKEKAEDVYGRLDKDSSTKFSVGLKKIEAAKGKIESVSSELKNVHSDLGDWKVVVQDVISKAAGKADEVSEQLDPAQQDENHSIGKNLNDIETSEKAINEANESLQEEVTKLSKSITEADRIREQAQQKAQEVYDSLTVHNELSEKIKEIQAANQKIKDVNTGLKSVDSKLGEWNKEASTVIEGVVKTATEVYDKLNHGDNQQVIGQGIKQIQDAKQNVDDVAKGLTSVNEDLQKWREAAETVLSTTVDKAAEVHKALDPAKGKSTLGEQIDAIDTAGQYIKSANDQLKSQVGNLSKWMQDAEDIRHKAEEKVREAYNKLQVNEKLSKNVKRIVDAKEKIDKVHNAVETQVKELGRWKDQTECVIGRAIKNAEYVNDTLRDRLDPKIGEIEQHNDAIKEAQAKLEQAVQHLGKWSDAAKNVIKKADEKCDEILRRVKTDPSSKDDTIYKQAELLKYQGIKLLKAADVAKQTVESKVKDALEAVKAMDTDLKKDLFEVKTNIAEGIKTVIEELKVDQLGDKVKEDLKQLRERIVNLKDKVDKPSGSGLVEEQLKALGKAKTPLTEKTSQIKTQTEEMDKKFKETIKDPLDKGLQAVEGEIEKLYGQINPGGSATAADKKQLHKIFEHMKKEVAVIKGRAGNGVNDQNSKGLEGIVTNAKVLAQQFHGGKKFENKVNGFVMEILRENKIVQGILKKYAQDKGLGENYTKLDSSGNSPFRKYIAESLQIHLRDEANAAGKKVEEKFGEADNSREKIQRYITTVKEGLTTFVNEIEKRLKVEQINNLEGSIDTLVGTIVSGIVNDIKSRGQPRQIQTNDDLLKLAVKRIFMKLIVIVRKVAAEVEFLGTKVFGKILDTIKPTVDELDKNLKAVTDTGRTPVHGTAQAVDRAIEGVKGMVRSTIEQKFESDVKTPVEQAVQGLEKAVTEYDKQVKEQVREAVKGAIEQAAEEISTDENVTLGDVRDKMENFNGAYSLIIGGLQGQLSSILDKQLTSRADKVDINKAAGFKKYTGHVSTGYTTDHSYGKMNSAINVIKGEGLNALENTIGTTAAQKIEADAFKKPFKAIEIQLSTITDVVTNEGFKFLGDKDESRKGVKVLLAELKDGFDNKPVGESAKGLDAITKAIGELRKNTFSPKSEQIGKAVTEMKSQVEDLKNKLKSDGKDDKDSVINALKDLKDAGLASGKWNGKDGRQVGGLQKIEDDLRKQNEELRNQTIEIGKAFDYTLRELKGMLAQVGLRLHNIIVPDDVMDNLKDIKLKIGRGKNIGLEHIHELIKKLQEGNFTHNPEEIGKAKDEITNKLKKLQDDLQGDKNNDVIETLRDLKDVGLGNGDWKKKNNTKGLEKIKNELKAQLDELSVQPDFIDLGIAQITKQLDELRTTFQSGNKNPNDDVINRLEDMRRNGLSDETKSWNGKDGLGKIRSNFQEQNVKLFEARDQIDKATDIVLSHTQSVLKSAEHKLRSDVANDDVLDHLEELKRKIGKDGVVEDSLQGIHNKIHELQEREFVVQSKGIVEAKKHIEEGLQEQRMTLQKNVTNPLNDLVNKGFGPSENWNYLNAKGFNHIQDNLNTQQDTLSQQPQDIQNGVELINDELQSIRDALQGTADGNPQDRGVIKNLEFMTKQIGTHDDAGLKKIKSDIESLKQNQVPVITKHLNIMSSAITNAAGQLGWNLDQLETPHIDVKLKGIQDGFKNLRLSDLDDAIKLCDDFLHKADEIERNTIAALLKHVDNEVDDAIKELTKEARTLYVDSVRDALELFARKVNEDLEQLPSDINHDLTIGFKGFMNAVEGDEGVNIKQLMCVESRELKHLSAALGSFLGEVNEYVRQETQRVHKELGDERHPSLPPTEDPYVPQLDSVHRDLNTVLNYICDTETFDDKLRTLLADLKTAIAGLVPSDFKHPSTPLLDTVASGLTKFAGEFGNCYISTYSGQRCREEHAHKYAKVLLSMVPMTYNALNKLATKCESEWKPLHISKFTADDRDNPLGNYLARCGYRVSSYESGQEGELNNMFTGGGIYELLATPIEDVDIDMLVDGEQVTYDINLVHIISLLYNTLCHYFQVCHLYVPPEPRYPCTVRDMLSWLSGLQYTQVADKLPDHCKALLNRRCHDGDTPNTEDPVMAKCIGELSSIIATTCSRSNALLTAIQGNGHGFDMAAYPYSVDFSNNRARLHYPADPDALLDMLREIVFRLCKVLYFLYSQCCRSTARVRGWRECVYGRQVQSHHWQCNTLGSGSATNDTTTTAATTTSSTAKHGCPPTSPLQSFLSDCCHGLLPHTLTAADGTIKCANCTVNQPGKQCLTPLGFWDLGIAASISGTGWDLANRLGDMCRDADSCLFVLCRTLFWLCPATPSSLADVFALYAQALRKWDPHDWVENRGGNYTDASDLISHLNTDSIDGFFPLSAQLHGSYENHKLTSAISSLAGHDHKSHDALSSLFKDSTCKPPSGCAPYLQPLGLHAHHTYPQKHAGLYITWIIYLAWEFWELLYQLLQALDNIDCTAAGCATCPCQPGIHGGKDACHCPSIVQCAGPLPTLYRYGFTYRNAYLLVTDNRAVRCGDLNTKLKQALHSGHFTELFRQIDKLIWHIRMPFFYCFIALWTLVALYILHNFLYRLDIFRIRSHLLTTKASHFIDVKALVIPNRKMLSLYDADYFDDDPIGNIAPQ
ncbi:hypothetical protein BBBOND_0405730 [Babesia bigemina]|uniref:Extracellular matrix-binding ebh n=1 Tax=Babesia bigemina TaxID=5866 RepID=A0A061DE97_BABBI|nr:hypothetical protein BBBOND_0405730 [Babesia bigemina]CDR98089.1 hypothetical protein BBBOND_0405730 [Babesia bigemina]|eukprot:XP_012770275.1 hypothetical protein BBBOND_0405730 [Babesia bigemina]